MRAVLLLAAILGGCMSSSRAPIQPDAQAADATEPEPDLAGPTRLDPQTAAIAGELHGAFLELACMSEEIEFQFCVPRDMGVRSLKLKFGGEFGKAYSV
ncbi:MAG TPA: hypothetical protein VN914_17600, partial [Polyangia bacterium]|nr:hypothetical protein [Polyangia bacterium]